MFKDRSQLVLRLVVIVLLIINIFLFVQNWRIKGVLERSRQAVTEEGYRFGEINFKSSDGIEERINLANGETKTLLLVFNSGCQYCKQQYPHWRELVNQLDSRGWRVLAISSEADIEKLRANMAEQNLENVRLGSVPAGEMSRARMLFTPMTLALDTNGEVRKVWSGLWTKGFDLQF